MKVLFSCKIILDKKFCLSRGLSGRKATLQWTSTGTLNPRPKSLSQQKATKVATIAYMQTTSDGLSRLLMRYNIKTIHSLVTSER
jgi:hypothetical protein